MHTLQRSSHRHQTQGRRLVGNQATAVSHPRPALAPVAVEAEEAAAVGLETDLGTFLAGLKAEQPLDYLCELVGFMQYGHVLGIR
jgi:hypothetical protein